MCEIMERIAKEEREEGKALINKLNSILIDLDRFDDVKRVAKDKEYQMQLMIELLPSDRTIILSAPATVFIRWAITKTILS